MAKHLRRLDTKYGTAPKQYTTPEPKRINAGVPQRSVLG